MALQALKYHHASSSEETKAGFYIYNGRPDLFGEWTFRTETRWNTTKEEDKNKTMSQIVEALRGDAAQVAMDIGTEELLRVGPGNANDPAF